MTETIARLHIAARRYRPAHLAPGLCARRGKSEDAPRRDPRRHGLARLPSLGVRGGRQRYGLPDRDWDDDRLFSAKNIKLKTLLDRGVSELLYTYDMGDSWEYLVTVEAIEDGEPGTLYPRYVDGECRPPPEDVGGTPGFEAFLDAIAKPKGRGHREVVQWHRGCYGKDFDPGDLDELAAKLRIGAIAKRRAAGKASFAKRGSAC